MSNLIRFKVGFADHRAHPDGIASASQVTRMLLLLPQAFRYIPGYSMSKFYFSEQAGSRTPAAWVKGGKAAIRYPVRFHGFELRGIIIIFVAQTLNTMIMNKFINVTSLLKIPIILFSLEKPSYICCPFLHPIRCVN